MNLEFQDIILDEGWGSGFKWFVIVSALLHASLVIFALVILPRWQPSQKPRPPIYTVNLMTLPPASAATAAIPQPQAKPEPVKSSPPPTPVEEVKAKPEPEKPKPEPKKAELTPVGPVKPKKEPEIKKIDKPAPKPKPKPKAKPKPKPKPKPKAVPKPKPTVKAKKNPNSEIENAVARVQSRIKKQQEEAHLQQAMANLAGRKGDGEGTQAGIRGSGAPSEIDTRMREYYIIMYNIISNNWVMPSEGLLRSKKNLEAVYVIRIDRRGSVVKAWFERTSGESLFDKSAELAVDRSVLPPLPDVFQGDSIEVGLRFTPSGVKSN